MVLDASASASPGAAHLASIPPADRRREGQVYTPVHLVEFILDQVGYVLDKKLAGATPTNDRASDELRRHALLAKADLVDIPTHCGLEINDVVDLTESRAGLSAAKRRVRGITTHYDKAKATYHQLVALGEV